MIIRRANINDKNTILEMLYESDIENKEMSETLNSSYTDEELIENNKKIIDKHIDEFYILEVNNSSIGTIMEWNNKGEVTLCNFHIKKEYRNKGYGKKLIDYMLNNSKDGYVVLSAFQFNNNAINFYKHIGFEEIHISETKFGKMIWFIKKKK